MRLRGNRAVAFGTPDRGSIQTRAHLSVQPSRPHLNGLPVAKTRARVIRPWHMFASADVLARTQQVQFDAGVASTSGATFVNARWSTAVEISPGKVLLAYLSRDAATGGASLGIVDFNAAVPTVGAFVNTGFANGGFRLHACGTDAAVLVYQNASGSVGAVAITAAGTTLTLGTPITLASANATTNAVAIDSAFASCAYSATQIIVTRYDTLVSGNIITSVVSRSGAALTENAATSFAPINGRKAVYLVPGEGSVTVCYNESGSASIAARRATISGNAISAFGTEAVNPSISDHIGDAFIPFGMRHVFKVSAAIGIVPYQSGFSNTTRMAILDVSVEPPVWGAVRSFPDAVDAAAQRNGYPVAFTPVNSGGLISPYFPGASPNGDQRGFTFSGGRNGTFVFGPRVNLQTLLGLGASFDNGTFCPITIGNQPAIAQFFGHAAGAPLAGIACVFRM